MKSKIKKTFKFTPKMFAGFIFSVALVSFTFFKLFPYYTDKSEENSFSVSDKSQIIKNQPLSFQKIDIKKSNSNLKQKNKNAVSISTNSIKINDFTNVFIKKISYSDGTCEKYSSTDYEKIDFENYQINCGDLLFKPKSTKLKNKVVEILSSEEKKYLLHDFENELDIIGVYDFAENTYSFAYISLSYSPISSFLESTSLETLVFFNGDNSGDMIVLKSDLLELKKIKGFGTPYSGTKGNEHNYASGFKLFSPDGKNLLFPILETQSSKFKSENVSSNLFKSINLENFQATTYNVTCNFEILKNQNLSLDSSCFNWRINANGQYLPDFLNTFAKN